jgi:hypothetical protein
VIAQHDLAALAHVAQARELLLVPASFAEYAPETNPETKRDVVWFALNQDRRLFASAGLFAALELRRLLGRVVLFIRPSS